MKRALKYVGATLLGIAIAVPLFASALGTIFIVQQGGTGIGANGIPTGDILYGGGTSASALSLLAPGANGQVLELASGLPSWATIANGSFSTTSAAYWLTQQTIAAANGGTGSTTLTGILKGNGTGSVLTAVGDTDYQKPISLTTTGSSGAATFSGDVLNVPQYAGTTYTATYPILLSGSALSLAFGTTTANTWSPTQTFSNIIATSTTATSTIANLNGTLTATAFSGTDIGNDSNLAYAAGSTNGVPVAIPIATSSNGVFQFTTPIVASTANKPILVTCPVSGSAHQPNGTILYYTPTTGTSTTINTNSYIVGGGTGVNGCVFEGGNGTTQRITDGIFVGGANGAFNTTLQNVAVSGFGTGVDVGSNVSFFNIINSILNFNGRNYSSPSVSGANCENMRMIDDVFADANNQAGGATALKGWYDQMSGNCDTQLAFNSFDDNQIYLDQYGGTANMTSSVANHMENPNGTNYPQIVENSGGLGSVLSIIGGDIMNDYTGGITTDQIEAVGQVNLLGFMSDANSNVTTPVTQIVTPLSSSTIITWAGLACKGANVASNVYPSVPCSPMGVGSGYGYPSFDVATSSATAIGGVGIGMVPVTGTPFAVGEGGLYPTTPTEVFKVNATGGVAIGFGTSIAAFTGDVLDMVQANGADMIATMQNFSSGHAVYFDMDAPSLYDSITFNGNFTSGTAQDYNFGLFGNNEFTLHDATNNTSPLLIASGTPTYTIDTDANGKGYVGLSTSTPGSVLSIGGVANFTTATSTFYGNGFNLTAGCYAINGTCVGGSGGGSGTVTSVGLSSTNSTLTIGSTPVTTSGTITADLNLAHSNTWSASQMFLASTTIGSGGQTNGLTVNGGATTSASIIDQASEYVATSENIGSACSTGLITTFKLFTCGSTSGNQVNVFQNFDGALNDSQELWLDTRASSGDTSVGGGIEAVRTNAANSGDNDLEFLNSAGTTANINMIIKATGSVGIGTTTPTASLQVTASTANATTSAEFGKASQNKGSCMTYFDTAGSPVYMFFAAGASTPTYQNGGTAPSGCKD